MILSKTINNNKKKYLIKLNKTIKLLSYLKTSKKRLKNLFFLFKNKNSLSTITTKTKIKSQNTVNYIINVVVSPTNTLINVADVKGNVIITASSGLIKLTKFQKRAQPSAMVSIFKHLSTKLLFLQNQTVSLHFKNVKRFHESLLLTMLKNFFLIKSFQSNNLSPHNGCRPKKIKRIKRRTKRLVLR